MTTILKIEIERTDEGETKKLGTAVNWEQIKSGRLPKALVLESIVEDLIYKLEQAEPTPTSER